MRALSLSHNWIGDAGVAVLCDAMRQRPTVTMLDVPDNKISDVGARELAALLRTNTTITQLHLGMNSITDAGATALAEVRSAAGQLAVWLAAVLHSPHDGAW